MPYELFGKKPAIYLIPIVVALTVVLASPASGQGSQHDATAVLSPQASKTATTYSAREVFVVADSRWDVVLPWVSVAVRTMPKLANPPQLERVQKHPFLIYHREAADHFDADSIIHFLQKYQPDRVTIIGTPPSELRSLIASYPSTTVGAGLHANQVQVVAPDSYLSYWQRPAAIVYTEWDYALALQASVFASLINAPLVIGRPFHEVLGKEQPLVPKGLDLSKTRVICIGAARPEIACTERFSATQLQRLYVQRAASRYIVLVNPGDLTIGTEGSFQPEKSALPIATTFSRLSLAAPALAASRHALLLPVGLEKNDCGPYTGTSNAAFLRADAAVDDAIGGPFARVLPTYLTVVGSPAAVPYWSECANSATGAADWKYGSLDNQTPGASVGRIYSVTTSDTSAYVARALFYAALMNRTYTSTQFTGLAIAAPGFSADQTNAETIRTKTTAAGYTTACFTGAGASSQPTCDIYSNISASTYAQKQFTSFADHGARTAWDSMLNSSDIPWLDLPYTFALACLTNDFFGGGSATFGPHWIRKGGLSYQASIPVTSGDNWELRAVQTLTGSTRLSLGKIATELIRSNDAGAGVRNMYVFLGDPAVVPRSQEVSW